MKKNIAILISLVFVASFFSITATMAFKLEANATPEDVKVGKLITVTSNTYPCDDDKVCYDPVIKIYDPSIEQYENWKDKSNAFIALPDGSIYATKFSGPIKTDGKNIWTWTYRANQTGKIVFGVPLFPASTPTYWCPTNPVTINGVSHPMNSFMKILGFGKND